MGEYRQVVVSTLLRLGAFVWLIVVPLMFLDGAVIAYGIGLAPGSPAAASSTFTGASWLGAGIPIVGLVVSATTRRRRWIWFYGVGVVVVVVVAGVRWAQTHPGPPPAPEPIGCVEHSGGGNECPGD